MEEKFNSIFEETSKLYEKSKKDSTKYDIYSQVPFYSTFLFNGIIDLNIFLELFVFSPFCYKEVLKEYKEIILRLSDMFDKNKITSLIDIQSAFVFMQKYGYLSENHSWQFKNSIDYLYIKIQGISLIGGYGCCRDLSCMLNELLENMDFSTAPLDIKVDWIKNIEPLYSIVDIEELCKILNIEIIDLLKTPTAKNDFIYSRTYEKEEMQIIKKRKKIPFNHTIVSTEYKGKVYNFDPTNHLYFKNYDKSHVTFYEEEIPLRASFGKNKKEKRYLLGLSSPDKEEIYSLYNECYIKNLSERERIFQKFYEDNKESYKRINEKVKIINKYW